VNDCLKVIDGMHYWFAKFPAWQKTVSVEQMKKGLIASRLFKITPEMMKYWDDELLSEEKTTTFDFKK
jgi:hypothetical protein